MVDTGDDAPDFTDLGINGVAKRSVFVVDADGRITTGGLATIRASTPTTTLSTRLLRTLPTTEHPTD